MSDETKLHPRRGPWRTVRDNFIDPSVIGHCRIVFDSAYDVAYCPPTDGDNGNANARRIVAAVNACEGIPTDALEAGAVADLLAAVEGLLAARDAGQLTTDEWDAAEAAVRKARGQ